MPSRVWLNASEAAGRQYIDETLDLLDEVVRRVGTGPVAPTPNPDALRAWIHGIDFEAPTEAREIIGSTLQHFQEANVHTIHPGYFGLFNPAPIVWGEIGDLIAARLNPQLAVWSHAPACVEVEEHTLRFVAAELKIPDAQGFFTSGGEEANRSGALVALVRSFPQFSELGLRSCKGQPVFYVSSQSHLAWLKIATNLGLGRAAIRLTPVDSEFRLDVHSLEQLIDHDRCSGSVPFLVCATAGTTSAGVIDPLNAIADIAENNGLHFHIDAAWAGAVALCRPWAHLLNGSSRADSITVDAHKWLSQPMGIGMFFSRDSSALDRTFDVSTSYMPFSTSNTRDYYRTSPAWSRRWVGLRLFLSLAIGGRSTFEAHIARDIELGQLLRKLLAESGWEVINKTELPVVCFTDAAARRGAQWHRDVTAHVVESGDAWISTVSLDTRPALRACVTNWQTGPHEIRGLVGALDRARTCLAATG